METLKTLQDASRYTLHEVLDRWRQYEQELPLDDYPRTCPQTHVGLLHLLNKGTDSMPRIRALAHVYDRPLEEMERIALDTKDLYKKGKNTPVLA